MTRIPSRALAAVAGAALLAACSSSATTTSSPPVGPSTTARSSGATASTSTTLPTTTTAPATSTTAASAASTTVPGMSGATTCKASQLTVSLSVATWDGLEGTSLFQPVEFGNTSRTPCYLQGAPKISFSSNGVPLSGLTFLGVTGAAGATVNPPGLSNVNGQPDPNSPALDPSTPPAVVLAPGRHAIVVLTEGTYTTGSMSVDCPGFRSPTRTISFSLPGAGGTVEATDAVYFECPNNDYQVSWFTSLSKVPWSTRVLASLHSRASFQIPPQSSTPS